jgi:hypothetical protein
LFELARQFVAKRYSEWFRTGGSHEFSRGLLLLSTQNGKEVQPSPDRLHQTRVGLLP